jgi:hypothetical protein
MAKGLLGRQICAGTGYLPRQSGGNLADGTLLGLCISCETFQRMEWIRVKWVLAPHLPEQEHKFFCTGAPL